MKIIDTLTADNFSQEEKTSTPIVIELNDDVEVSNQEFTQVSFFFFFLSC